MVWNTRKQSGIQRFDFDFEIGFISDGKFLYILSNVYVHRGVFPDNKQIKSVYRNNSFSDNQFLGI